MTTTYRVDRAYMAYDGCRWEPYSGRCVTAAEARGLAETYAGRHHGVRWRVVEVTERVLGCEVGRPAVASVTTGVVPGYGAGPPVGAGRDSGDAPGTAVASVVGARPLPGAVSAAVVVDPVSTVFVRPGSPGMAWASPAPLAPERHDLACPLGTGEPAWLSLSDGRLRAAGGLQRRGTRFRAGEGLGPGACWAGTDGRLWATPGAARDGGG